METIETVLEQARDRGLQRGKNDAAVDNYYDSPLSGEWAGESVPELLGDLIATAERIYLAADGDGDLIMETVIGPICDSYIDGYHSAFADRSFCDECGTLVNGADGATDDFIVLCGSFYGNGCADRQLAAS